MISFQEPKDQNKRKTKERGPTFAYIDLLQPVTYHDDDHINNPKLATIGRKGPLDIAPANPVKELKPFRDALHEAWTSRGHNITEDIYSGAVNGLCNVVASIYNGVRSTSHSFVQGKSNVTLLTGTKSKRILIEDNVATGIVVFGPDGGEVTYKARKEVVISSGVFETPKLLMISGVGPTTTLASHNIAQVANSPQVGQNLLDHPILPHVFRLKDGYGLDHIIRPGPQHDAAEAEYNSTKGGPFSSGLLELVGFARVDEGLKKRQEWVIESERLGGDPFGPEEQPHFEYDFVVSTLAMLSSLAFLASIHVFPSPRHPKKRNTADLRSPPSPSRSTRTSASQQPATT